MMGLGTGGDERLKPTGAHVRRLTATFLATAAALLLAPLAEGQSERPDFHLLLEKCRTTVGYLVLSDESLKAFEGEPVYNACTRRSRKVSCTLSFPGAAEGIKGRTAEYSVVLDSPPHLHFTDAKYADYFAVNLSEHSVVLVTRVAFEKGLGSKVCHGIFATDDEMKALGKAKPPGR